MSAERVVFNHETSLSYLRVSHARALFPSGRALVGSRPGDVVQMEPELETELPAIRDHYSKLGFSCADEIVFRPDLEVIAEYPDAEWSTYIFSESHHRVRPNAARLAATQQFDQKNTFIAWCRQHGHPVPATELFERGAVPELKSLQLPMYVKASWSLGGYDVFTCHSDEEMRAAIARIDGDYQLQEALDAVAWLNVMYRVEGRAVHVATTEQQLNGAMWQGARFPSSYDPRPVTDPIAEALVDAGLEGLFGIDVAVLARDGGLSYVVMEANPRTNASTYFQWAADRIGAPAWVGCNVSTRHRSLEPVLTRVDDLVFSETSGSGIVVTNWGPILGGRVGVLFVGTDEQQRELREDVCRRLS